MERKQVVVIGGSIAGLGVALALSGRGHRVSVLEADATPMPASPSDAFEHWERRGAPQARQSHALLARLRNLIRDHAPVLLEKLVKHGAEELRFEDRLQELFPGAPAEEGDADIVSLACRRITFEWVLRRHVIDTGLVEFLDGVEVTRLGAAPDGATGLPRVTGVWAKPRGAGGRLFTGDLVVDASGRRSKLHKWLPEIGTAPVREESSPCGIFYTSRFYRLLDSGESPELEGGLVGVDLGYLKFGVFAGDSRVFSITVAASPDDAEMRRVLHRPAFEAAVAAVPMTAQWTSSAVSEPVSDVHGMANLNNSRRWLVEDGVPLVLGFAAVGDSLIHTNPIVGRGCSLAWTSAFALAECLAQHGSDPRGLALAYHEHVERDIAPWYALQLAQDADSIDVSAAQQRGEDPFALTNADGSANPKAFTRSLLKEGLMPALREDAGLLRAFSRTINLLDSPGAMMQNPAVMQSLLASCARREEREKVWVGPSREAMVECFAVLEDSASA
jgi:2-polyprenyl-6-methoxyphenol hydroxylase-like FAD-dependent oxidoreductase